MSETFDYRGARERIFSAEGLGAVERMLLLVLVEFAPNIEPSIDSLVKMTGMCERSVRNTLRALEQKGAIRTSSRFGRRSRYELTMLSHPGKICPPPRQTVPPCDTDSPRQTVPPTPAESAPPPRQDLPPKQTSKADKKAEEISAQASPAPVEGAPLVLTSVESKSRKAKSPPKPKETKAKHPGYARVVEAYFSAFEGKNGRKPVFGAGDGKWVNALLEAVTDDTDEACRIVHNAFTPGRWFAGVTIKTIGSDPSKFLTAGSATGGLRKSVERQQGDNPELQVGSKWAAKGNGQVVPLPARAAR